MVGKNESSRVKRNRVRNREATMVDRDVFVFIMLFGIPSTIYFVLSHFMAVSVATILWGISVVLVAGIYGEKILRMYGINIRGMKREVQEEE